jgi:hypothetical protein
MRDALVFLFKDRFNCNLFWEIIPENANTDPVACYGISNEQSEREIDGSGVGVHFVDFDIDVLSESQEELDKIKCGLLLLNGNRWHRYRDKFQMLFVRSIGDSGAALGVTTESGNEPHVMSIKLTLYA